jgi:phage-related protein
LADYAAKTGQDMPSAATALGKAFSGNAKALKSIGINYKATGDASKDFANVQALLNDKVGGFAESQGKTAAGQAAILHNQFGELQETVGAKLVPILTTLAEKLLKIVDFVQRNSAVIGPLVAVIGGIVAGVKAWAIAQAILNSALLANPIGIAVVAIAALAAGLIYAYKHSEKFRNIVNGVFSAVGSAASAMWNVIRPVLKMWADVWLAVVGVLVHGAASAFGWVPGIGGKLKGAAAEFDKFKTAVNNSLDGINETKTITIKAVSSKTAEASANAGIRSGRMSGSEAAASVVNRTRPVVNVHNTVDKRGITSVVTSQTAKNTQRGAMLPGMA